MASRRGRRRGIDSLTLGTKEIITLALGTPESIALTLRTQEGIAFPPEDLGDRIEPLLGGAPLGHVDAWVLASRVSLAALEWWNARASKLCFRCWARGGLTRSMRGWRLRLLAILRGICASGKPIPGILVGLVHSGPRSWRNWEELCGRVSSKVILL